MPILHVSAADKTRYPIHIEASDICMVKETPTICHVSIERGEKIIVANIHPEHAKEIVIAWEGVVQEVIIRKMLGMNKLPFDRYLVEVFLHSKPVNELFDDKIRAILKVLMDEADAAEASKKTVPRKKSA